MSSKRPKSSIAGLGDLAITAYNTAKLRRVATDFSDMQSSLDSKFELQRNEIASSTNALAILQSQTIVGLGFINSELDTLNRRIESVQSSLDRMEKRKENAGNIRLMILKIEDEIQNIQSNSQNFPVYAAYLAQMLSVSTNHIDFENLKDLSGTDMRWARDVINQTKILSDNLVEAADNKSLTLVFEKMGTINVKKRDLDRKLSKRKHIVEGQQSVEKEIEEEIRKIDSNIRERTIEEYIEGISRTLSKSSQSISEKVVQVDNLLEQKKEEERKIKDGIARYAELGAKWEKRIMLYIFPLTLPLLGFIFAWDEMTEAMAGRPLDLLKAVGLWYLFSAGLYLFMRIGDLFLSEEEKETWDEKWYGFFYPKRQSIKRIEELETDIKKGRNTLKSMKARRTKTEVKLSEMNESTNKILSFQTKLEGLQKDLSNIEQEILTLDSEINDDWNSISIFIPTSHL